MKSHSPSWPWQRKSMRYLMLAALCVTWTGFTFNSNQNLVNFTLVSAVTIFLILFVYGFDDVMDAAEDVRSFQNPTVRWLGLAAVGTTLSCLYFLGWASFFFGDTDFNYWNFVFFSLPKG